MLRGFDTSNDDMAIAAMFVYGIYRSRDQKKFKVTPDMWGQIERAVKSAAKRAMDVTDFIEKLKPKISCATIQPQWMKEHDNLISGFIDKQTGEIFVSGSTIREFWVQTIDACDNEAVLMALYKKTSLIIALVRDRLERERPAEQMGLKKIEAEEFEQVELPEIEMED